MKRCIRFSFLLYRCLSGKNRGHSMMSSLRDSSSNRLKQEHQGGTLQKEKSAWQRNRHSTKYWSWCQTRRGSITQNQSASLHLFRGWSQRTWGLNYLVLTKRRKLPNLSSTLATKANPIGCHSKFWQIMDSGAKTSRHTDNTKLYKSWKQNNSFHPCLGNWVTNQSRVRAQSRTNN